FFSSRRRHTRFSRDWSSDVCSSDLVKPREVSRYCAPDRLKSDERIIVQLKSTWFPIGECSLRNRGTMEIYREKSDETDSGEVTKIGRASCRERVAIVRGRGSVTKKG